MPSIALGDIQSLLSEQWSNIATANPLNILLALVAGYFFLKLVLPSSIASLTPTLAQARSPKYNASTSYSFLPDDHPPSTTWKIFTPRTLAVHDGSAPKSDKGAEESKILLAIEGQVFDVTKGANFYGPGM